MSTDVYRLSHQWRIEGPIETVFHYVADARTFLDWFPVFKEVRPDDPYGELRVGSHVLCHVTALLPYVLDWDITGHGLLFAQYIEQRGPRGDRQFGSLNWGMLMASHPLAGGMLAEPGERFAHGLLAAQSGHVAAQMARDGVVQGLLTEGGGHVRENERRA